jgi:hypothetical protein
MLDGLTNHPEYLIPISAIVGGCLVGLVAVLVCNWRMVRKAEVDAALKQDMLNRGLSVDQIERIIRASPDAPADGQKPDPVSDNEYYLIEKLVDEGRPVEEIERIVRACKGAPPSDAGKKSFPADVAS